jgi:retron-type reverse transcriptase
MGNENNIQLLRLFGFPVFASVGELAELIHVDAKTVRGFITDSSYYYYQHFIPKKNGEKREILEPCSSLKAIQAWLKVNILDKLQASQYATAFEIGRGLMEAVEPHRRNRYFVCLDISNFFTSIKYRRVRGIFSMIGYSENASNMLANLCTYKNYLPQGAVTSPKISNLVCLKMDRRLAGYLSRRNIVYTRYADDITISNNEADRLYSSLGRVIKIISSEHFVINKKKTKFLKPSKSCKILGFVKDAKNPLFSVGREKIREMRTIMYRMAKGENNVSKYSTEESIQGYMDFLKGNDVKNYERMQKYREKLEGLFSPGQE